MKVLPLSLKFLFKTFPQPNIIVRPSSTVKSTDTTKNLKLHRNQINSAKNINCGRQYHINNSKRTENNTKLAIYYF